LSVLALYFSRYWRNDMLVDVDKMPVVEKQHLMVLKWYVENSHDITPQQKTRIESKLQEIVDIWNEGKKA